MLTNYIAITTLTHDEIVSKLLSEEGINGLRLDFRNGEYFPMRQNEHNFFSSFWNRGTPLYTSVKGKKIYNEIQVKFARKSNALNFLVRELEKIAYINR